MEEAEKKGEKGKKPKHGDEEGEEVDVGPLELPWVLGVTNSDGEDATIHFQSSRKDFHPAFGPVIFQLELVKFPCICHIRNAP